MIEIWKEHTCSLARFVFFFSLFDVHINHLVCMTAMPIQQWSMSENQLVASPEMSVAMNTLPCDIMIAII